MVKTMPRETNYFFATACLSAPKWRPKTWPGRRPSEARRRPISRVHTSACPSFTHELVDLSAMRFPPTCPSLPLSPTPRPPPLCSVSLSQQVLISPSIAQLHEDASAAWSAPALLHNDLSEQSRVAVAASPDECRARMLQPWAHCSMVRHGKLLGQAS